MGVRMINLVLTVENSSAVLAVEISWAFFLHVPKVGKEREGGREGGGRSKLELKYQDTALYV